MADQKKQQNSLLAELEKSLQVDILDRWYPAVIDTTHGGFLSDFAFDWQPTGPHNKMIVSQTRHVWTTSEAAMFYKEDRFREYAEHGFRFLRDQMWDNHHGGFFTWLNREGKPFATEEKSTYGNAFAIYALASYYRLSGDSSALQLAQKTFHWLDQHAHDPQHRGYFDRLTEDGSRVFESNLEMEPWQRMSAGWKDQNSSIHLLEAFTALYQIWPDSLLQQRLMEMLELVRDTITTDKGYLTLFLQRDWTPVSFRDSSEAVRTANNYYDHVSFGHDVETAYLMLEAAHALGMGDDKKTHSTARKMVDHALEFGWDDSTGGFFYQGYYFDESGPISIINNVKTWWVQAEGLNALLLMNRLYPDEHKYFSAFRKQWTHIKKYLIDHQHGEWYEEGLDYNPDQVKAAKARDWKVNYHNFRALRNSIEMLKGVDHLTSGGKTP